MTEGGNAAAAGYWRALANNSLQITRPAAYCARIDDLNSSWNAAVIRNAVDLTERWAALTGEPLKETRQRVRVLRAAGLLPDARIDRDPLTDLQVARFIIASLASGTQDGSADAARTYGALPPHEWENQWQPTTPLSGMNLGDALAELVRHAREGTRWELMEAEFNRTRPIAVLRFHGHNLVESEKANLAYAHDRPGETTPPVAIITRFYGRLLRALVRGPADESWPGSPRPTSAGGPGNSPEGHNPMQQLITKRETADLMRISERGLDRLIADGNGPPVTRIGARVLFRPDQLEAWIKSRQQ